MKSMKKTLYPGSFDPITYGHMDVIEQALNIFDKVIIAILVNPKKNNGLFSFEERENLIKKIYENDDRIEVIRMIENKATVDIALDYNCTTLIRGLRNITDFAEEVSLSEVNLLISNNNVHTVAFFANPGKTTISSTNVKVLFNLGKDISKFVHPIVIEAIKNKLKE